MVRPFGLVYFDQSRSQMCWCELRNDFHNSRSDRITVAELPDARYPKHRQPLLRELRRAKYVAGRSLLPETDISFDVE